MFPKNWHRYLFLVSLICLSSGALFGSSLMSIGQIALSANWFLEGNYINKIKNLYYNKIFWLLISLYLLHVFAMVYTDNLHSGFADLGSKIPLLIVPILFFSTKPLSSTELKLVLNLFYASVILSSIYCFVVYLGYTKRTVINPRDASVFMSHIRFSLCIAFAVCGLVYNTIYELTFIRKIVSALAVLWLLFFMYQLELMTGFVCLSVVAFAFFIYILIKRLPTKISILGMLLFIVVITFVVVNIKQSLTAFDAKPNNISNKLLSKTINNRTYLQDTLYGLAENGTLIGINISDYEIEKEWEKRSKIPYNGIDKKGNELRYTILHYMASKGLTKDSIGISKLFQKDISLIEEGFTNYLYVTNNVFARWREIVWEYTKYQRGENPSGHTLTMRLEFWKTAFYLIKQKPLLGSGTGDIQDSFNKAYQETQTKLNKTWWLRCHNQYLAITVAFGIIGLALFLFYLIYPALLFRNKLHVLYWCFYLIVLTSFLSEDTLETQAGVTLFAFFQCLFLWLASPKKVLN